MRFTTLIFGLLMLVLGFYAGHEFAAGNFMGRIVAFVQFLTADRTPVKVRAIAQKYTWQFHYPGPDGAWGKTSRDNVTAENPLGLAANDPAAEDDYGSPELVLPCGRPVELKVDSYDVIHCLGELQGDLRIDGIPGVKNEGTFQAPEDPKAGRLRCVQLCGPGHQDHHAPFRFVTKDTFETWQIERKVEAEVFRGKDVYIEAAKN